jgi:16S rRNA processing protein RimM
MIELGVVGRPHGVRGDVRLWPYNANTVLLVAGRSLSIGSNVETRRAVMLVKIRRDGRGPIASFAGVNDRDQAKALTGQRWYETRASFPELAGDEVYVTDLIGLRARLEDGTVIGTVAAVWTDAPADIIVIRDGTREHLVPNVAEFVRQMDLEKGEIVIHPIEGLLGE